MQLKNKFNKNTWHIIRNFVLLGMGIALFFVGAIVAWVGFVGVPDFSNVDARQVINSTKIYDRTGEIVLYDFHKNTKRTEIPFSEMGDNIKKATVAIEDDQFYSHNGVRLTSIARAVLVNLLHGGAKKQGGSTITQQVVKNTLLTQDKSIARKIKEVVLALKIEKTMTKDQILALYLNESPYGGTVYGIKEASRMFFGKNPADVTIAESAYLAAIPKGPTLYSPYGKNRALLEGRKNAVLDKMLATNVITKEEYDKAKAEVVTFKPQESTGIKAPHFVFYVQNYLQEKYGDGVLEAGGLNVITTLDYDLQQKAEEVVKKTAPQLEKDWGATNQALVAIDPKNGQIISMVGSRDYFDKQIDGAFNIATARRQPGSSFKPFVYAAAFAKGYTPDTTLFDVRTEFSTRCNAYSVPNPGSTKTDCYNPDNFDGKFKGPISMRDALQESRNVPAVKTLYLVGVDEAMRTARALGVNLTGDKNQYGLSLVLGGGEVSLLDMTSAYGVLANNGVKEKITPILSVKDKEGKELESFQPEETPVMDTNVTAMISNVLSDNDARIPTFGANSALYIAGRQVAAKTGTTNNNKDAWLVGYTPSIAVGVWAGNNDNKPMKKGGAAVAGPTWNEFMRYALSKTAPENFPTAQIPYPEKPVLHGAWLGGESFYVDKISGKLATDLTPEETKQERVITDVHDILYWVNRNDPTGPAPFDPSNDGLFSHWETSVQDWWSKNRNSFPVVSAGSKPTSYDDVHTEATKPKLTIMSPVNGTTVGASDSVTVSVSTVGVYPLKKIDVYINNILIGSSNGTSYTFTPSAISSVGSENTLRVVGVDTVYNRGETSTQFNVN